MPLCSVMCVRSPHRPRAAVVVLRSVARSRSRAPPHTHKSTCDACMRTAWTWTWTWAHAKCTTRPLAIPASRRRLWRRRCAWPALGKAVPAFGWSVPFTCVRRVPAWPSGTSQGMNGFSSQSVSCLVSGGWVIVHSLSAYPAAIIAFWTQYNGAGGGASACVRHVSVRNGRRGVSLQRARLVSGETVSTLPCFLVQGCLLPHRRPPTQRSRSFLFAWVRPW